MSGYRSLVHFVNGATAFTLALLAVVWALNADATNAFEAFMRLPAGKAVAVAAGVLLLAVNLIYLLSLREDRYALELTHHGEGGSVSVSLAAVEDSLRRAARSLPEVSDVRVVLAKPKPAKGFEEESEAVQIRVSFATWEGENVPEVSEKLREALRLRMSEVVPLSPEPEYDITCFRIQVRSTGGSRREDDRKPSTFRGPQYPLDLEM